MKKTILLSGALLAGLTMTAQDIVWGNPKAADGSYVVQYDMERMAFYPENEFEFDETFVFAVDITGNPILEGLAKKDQYASGDWEGLLGVGVAYDFYITSNGEGAPGGSIDGRLFHIKDNIYGMTLNFYQQYQRPGKKSGMRDANGNIPSLEIGNVAGFNENLFGFGWSQDNPGFMWWDAVAAPQCGGLWFHSAPYTGTKTSPEFTYADFVEEGVCPFEGLDPGAFHAMVDDWGGYARPEDYKQAVREAGVIAASISNEVVSTEYVDLAGRRLQTQPENGLYIRVSVMADGTRKTVKEIVSR